MPEKLKLDPEPNLPLLRKVFEHLQTKPRDWNQSSFGEWLGVNNSMGQFTGQYRCNTSMCFAGWAVQMSDYDLNNVEPRSFEVDKIAQHKLGLTENEANWLFFGTIHGDIIDPTTGDKFGERYPYTADGIKDAEIAAIRQVLTGIFARAGETL
jgi:hypothetical protein